MAVPLRFENTAFTQQGKEGTFALAACLVVVVATSSLPKPLTYLSVDDIQ